MIVITDLNRKTAFKRAETLIAELSERQLTEKADKLASSSDGFDRIISIAIRTALMGGTEKAFRKACKAHEKTEHIRIKCA